MSDWNKFISDARQVHGIRTRKGATDGLIDAFDQKHGPLPKELKKLLMVTNGLSLGWFRVLPIKDDQELKGTWDDLERANNINTSRFLSRDPNLLDRFFVFAEIGGTRSAAFDKKDGTIWYEEDNEMVQTDLNLEDFIQLSLKEVKEL
jgi:hypothetical protein